VFNHSSGLVNRERPRKHSQGVWNECLEVKRSALPVGPAHHTQVTDCAKPVSVIEIRFLNAMKPVKPTGVPSVE